MGGCLVVWGGSDMERRGKCLLTRSGMKVKMALKVVDIGVRCKMTVKMVPDTQKLKLMQMSQIEGKYKKMSKLVT